MSCGRDDEQQHLLASLQKRAAAGQIDRRGFLHLAAAIGLEVGFAAALANQAMAAPLIQRQGGGGIATAYDYIIVGAGSAGCAIAARLSENAACRVLLVEAGGADISRSALQSPVLWASNFGTDVDWACRTIPQARAAGRIIDWPRGKVIGGSASINAMIWVWGAAADFDQWAYAGCQGWDYARLKTVFQSIETCARKSLNRDRGTNGPLHVEPVADPNPLSAGFFKACEEMGHQLLEDAGAPVRDGAGYMDFNTKDGQRFSVVHGYLLPPHQDHVRRSERASSYRSKLSLCGGRSHGLVHGYRTFPGDWISRRFVRMAQTGDHKNPSRQKRTEGIRRP
jgi:choline dehydrogenase-like flavoprotein